MGILGLLSVICIIAIVWLVVNGVNKLEREVDNPIPHREVVLISGGETYSNSYRYEELGNGYGRPRGYVPAGMLGREDAVEVGNIIQGAKCCLWEEDRDMQRIRRESRNPQPRVKSCTVVDKIENGHILEVELYNAGNSRCSCFCEIPSCFTRNPFSYINETEALTKMHENRRD